MVIRWRGLRAWIGLALALWAGSALAYLIGGRTVAVLSRLVVARLVPIYKVDVAERRVALSFDATWGTSRTDRLLEILRRHGVKTTFFLAGNWVERYPEYVRKIAAEGHEIGNHSYTHPHMASLSADQIRQELEQNQRRIDALVGRPDVLLFRPPFGEYSDTVIRVASELGYYTVQWSVDSLDWQDLSADTMVERILRGIEPGDIVLFHNDGTHTPEAVDRLIPLLKARGFRIVPVSQLIYHTFYIIDPHWGLQRRQPLPPIQPPPAH